MDKKRIVVIILCGVMILGSIGTLTVIKVKERQNQEKMEALQETVRSVPDIEVEIPEVEEEEPVVIPIDFEEAWQENEDIVAWLEVPQTQVDYPILQSKPEMEEDFYLSHNLDGSGGYPGCVYIQKLNAADFTDQVTVVYGHNMKNGSIFATLHNYEDREFFDTNNEFHIYTPTTAQTYRVIAAVNYDDRLIPAYFNNFTSPSDVENFIKDIYSLGESERNHFYENSGIEGKDHYVVLSTCTSNSSNRWLVVGILDKDLE
ncbi:MAG: class B sortase [Lachnospiraceae bacterium]|nr:class B sortase [Lachnospiraceae bacterium]